MHRTCFTQGVDLKNHHLPSRLRVIPLTSFDLQHIPEVLRSMVRGRNGLGQIIDIHSQQLEEHAPWMTN